MGYMTFCYQKAIGGMLSLPEKLGLNYLYYTIFASSVQPFFITLFKIIYSQLYATAYDQSKQ